MLEEINKNPVDVQAFVQRKLQILNSKNGTRYERDAARVVQNNIVLQDNSQEDTNNVKM